MRTLFLLLLCTAAYGQETLNYASSTLTGTVTLTQALLPNQANQAVTASAYNFSVNGILQSPGGPGVAADATQSFVFSTDASGNITSWSINVSGFADPGVDGIAVDFMSSPFADFLAMTECAPFLDPQNGGGCQIDPVVQTDPGTWTVASITPVAPQPTVAQLQAEVAALQSQVATMNAWMAEWVPYYEWQAAGSRARAATLAQQLANANAEIAVLKTTH